jgi:hypothetical protein
MILEIVCLERCPLSLLSKIEELLGRNNSGFYLENREYGHGDPLRWPRGTLSAKVGTNFADIGGRSVGIVRLRTKTTEFVYFCKMTDELESSHHCSTQELFQHLPGRALESQEISQSG